MQNNFLKFRWINASCYEFILADGRVITTDPYLDRRDEGFTAGDLSTPDYVFITHTHYDHIMEVGELMRRSDGAKLFVSELAADGLLEYFDLKFGQIYGVSNGDRLTVDGIGILPSQGKHSRFKVRDKEYQSALLKLTADECGATDLDRLTSIGSTVYTDYVITLPGNLRIFITGGDMTYSTPYETAREQAPFIVIRQVSNLDSPEQYAEIVARLGGKIVLPHHQEHAPRRLGMSMDEFAFRAAKRLGEIAPDMILINPTQYKWYTLGLTCVEE